MTTLKLYQTQIITSFKYTRKHIFQYFFLYFQPGSAEKYYLFLIWYRGR